MVRRRRCLVWSESVAFLDTKWLLQSSSASFIENFFPRNIWQVYLVTTTTIIRLRGFRSIRTLQKGKLQAFLELWRRKLLQASQTYWYNAWDIINSMNYIEGTFTLLSFHVKDDHLCFVRCRSLGMSKNVIPSQIFQEQVSTPLLQIRFQLRSTAMIVTAVFVRSLLEETIFQSRNAMSHVSPCTGIACSTEIESDCSFQTEHESRGVWLRVQNFQRKAFYGLLMVGSTNSRNQKPGREAPFFEMYFANWKSIYGPDVWQFLEARK